MLSQPSLSWNDTLIHLTSFPFESELIKHLPLLQEPIEDQPMWPHTKEGTYTVKTGYNTLKRRQENTNSSTTNPDPHNIISKRIWIISTIPRHKVMLWRIINKAIPVRSVLGKRGFQCTILCPRCLQKEETIDHVLMECEKAIN
ncbi:retrotransposon unclassified-like protein [Trifolium medium]|uniref:Retrotransposon unclassified-like protein n=1 Tax=Trifolium medium TaxID=97028 RepID=A0A392MTS8_9FABA|nr:retrotransposon unclassified-like protein [Trifolium medium]